jgi:hypothetical protein
MYISLLKYLRSSWTIVKNVVVEDGVVGCRVLPWRWFSSHLLLYCFMKDIPVLKGKKITFLIGVSCMKKRKIEALFESFLEEEEE